MISTGQKIGLLRGFLTGHKAYIGPIHLSLELTSRCNLNCFGCPYHPAAGKPLMEKPGRPMDVSFELVQKVSKEAARLGTKVFLLTGQGEPFLHPRLFDLIAEIRLHIPYITLLTNGTLLDESGDDLLLNSGAHTLRIGCVWYLNEYLPSEKRERLLAGLERSIHRISQKKKSRGLAYPKLDCIIPIHSASLGRTEPFMRLLMNAGCDGLYFTPFKSYGESFDAHVMHRDSIEVLKRMFEEWKPDMKRHGIEHNMDEALLRFEIGEDVCRHTPCYVGWYHTRVEVDGRVRICNHPCEQYMGNCTQNSLHEIWRGSLYEQFRRSTLGNPAAPFGATCGYCCHLPLHHRIHRVFHWIPRAAYAKQLTPGADRGI